MRAQTQNLETPTQTVTGTVVDWNNWEPLAQRLRGECLGTDGWGRFAFSSKLCDALDACYADWSRKFSGARRQRTVWGADARGAQASRCGTRCQRHGAKWSAPRCLPSARRRSHTTTTSTGATPLASEGAPIRAGGAKLTQPP
jgi:hypothetical protein